MLISEKWTTLTDIDLKPLAAHYAAESYVVLPGFLSDAALALLRKETERLVDPSARKDFAMECMGGSARRMRTLGAPVIDALSSLVPDLYYAKDLLELVKGIVGAEVHPLFDDVDRYVLNSLVATGDTFGAHFDDYPLSLVVVVEVADQGGNPRLRADADQVLDVMDDHVEVRLAAGDAYLLRSDTTAHYVSPLEGPGRRLAFNFAYALKPESNSGTESPGLLYSRAESGFDESPVCSYSEWDPLEEVIVGMAVGSTIPAESERMIRATMPDQWHDLFRTEGGSPFPADVLAAAQDELDGLAAVLTEAGVVVRRPESPDWSQLGGHTSAMPRDSLLVVGTHVIEAPMAWRSRQTETSVYRSLLAGYADRGATWVSAPRTDPRLLEAADGPWAVNDSAPAFDAADFLRVGRDVIGQLSHVTNRAGARWLQNYLGSDFTVTLLDFDDPHAMHIDATVMPLRPGVLLVNGERVPPGVLDRSPFARWDRIVVPKPRPLGSVPRYMTSGWLSMNVLSLDAERVVVEANDTELARQLEERGFQVLLLPFEHVNAIGGSFHCATLDVRRRGTRESYV